MEKKVLPNKQYQLENKKILKLSKEKKEPQNEKVLQTLSYEMIPKFHNNHDLYMQVRTRVEKMKKEIYDKRHYTVSLMSV